MSVILNTEPNQGRPDALEALNGKAAQALIKTVVNCVIKDIVPFQAVGATLGRSTQRAVRTEMHREIDPVDPKIK